MKLTTVLGSVNNNPNYYRFIPIQITFWKKFGINFICVFAGQELPDELKKYKKHIKLWKGNKKIKSAFLGQNLRIYFPALLKLPDDEMVMITDMDMMPTNFVYYKNGLENFKKEDFIYYRYVDDDQIYMCYNAAHPQTWANVFNIKSRKDVRNAIRESYQSNYSGRPGGSGWYSDQLIMYRNLINYPHLQVLGRPIRRLEVEDYRDKLERGENNFLIHYDDVHFHRSFFNNVRLIEDALKQLDVLY